MLQSGDKSAGRKRSAAQMNSNGSLSQQATSPLMVSPMTQPNTIPLQQTAMHPQQQNMFPHPGGQPPLYANPLLGGNMQTTDAQQHPMLATAPQAYANGSVAGVRPFPTTQPQLMANGLAATDANNQIALRNRFPNSMIRMSNYQFPHGISPEHSGLALGSGDPNAPNMLSSLGGIDEQAELAARIRKMKGKKANIPPFVQKLSQFVNDPKCDHLIRWSDSGESFLVLDEEEFSKTLIPDLFKHNNYASFVRQLNMYGFHKVVGLADGSLKTSEQRSKPPSEYQNPYFKRGMPDLMWLIQKPKNNSKKKKGKKVKPDPESEEEGSTSEGNNDEAGVANGSQGALDRPASGPPQKQQSSAAANLDLSNITHQLEALRNHQALISMAINKLKREHHQLYEQSRNFQVLHDRHEATINAILSFLAQVYDKGLGGHIGGALANLFNSSAVADAIPRAQDANGAVIGSPASSVRPMRAGVPNVLKRRQLLLENGPTQQNGFVSPASPTTTAAGSPPVHGHSRVQSISEASNPLPFASAYQSPTTELFIQDEDEIGKQQDSPKSALDSNIFSPNAAFRSPLSQQLSKSLQSIGSPVQRSSSLTPRLPQRAITPLSASNSHAQNLLASGKDIIQSHQDRLRETSQEIHNLEELQRAQDVDLRRLVEQLMEAQGKTPRSNIGTPQSTASDSTTQHAIASHNGNANDSHMNGMGHVLGPVDSLNPDLDLGNYLNDDLFSRVNGVSDTPFDPSSLDGLEFNDGDLSFDPTFNSGLGVDAQGILGTDNIPSSTSAAVSTAVPAVHDPISTPTPAPLFGATGETLAGDVSRDNVNTGGEDAIHAAGLTEPEAKRRKVGA